MFVRQSQLAQIADVTGEPPEEKTTATNKSPKSPGESGLKQPGGIPGPASGAKSRLPTPGSGPTGGRSPSFTQIQRAKNRTPLSGSQQSVGMQRERSFVETNFVETLKQPQIQVTPQTPRAMGSPAASKMSAMSASVASPSSIAMATTQKMAERLEEKAANIGKV